MNWISVKNQMPEDGFLPCETCSLTVLIWTTEMSEQQDTDMGYWCWRGGEQVWQYLSGPLSVGEVVTHWMPLPEPPEEKQ